ncbi:MAG: HEAT repeat domain-containing protein [Cyanobacteria bacterium P01_D01_bin.6]
MDKRFFKLFDLTEEKAIAILDTPPDQVGKEDSRYIAVSHLVNFPTEQSIQALIRALQQTDPSLDNRIVRRKAIETLGRLQVAEALPLIRSCLAENDKFTVENAVWAIGEIGTQDPILLAEITALLGTPDQNYRVIIQTLAKLNYHPALEPIRPFSTYPEPPVVSAAISAICQLTGETTPMSQVTNFLQHPNVMARRLAIQDLIDTHYDTAIPAIAQCPVSLVFRLRGIRSLAEAGIAAGHLSFEEIQPSLEQTLRDHPSDLTLVSQYDRPPELAFLIRELYDTDFGRCYLATKQLLKDHAETTPEALLATYREEACADYGAHFHVVKLLGWLRYAPAYDLFIEALHNQQPQFQKSRAAAAIALGELGDRRAIDELKTCFNTRIWDLKYAALMALQKLGETASASLAIEDDDWLVNTKARLLMT